MTVEIRKFCLRSTRAGSRVGALVRSAAFAHMRLQSFVVIAVVASVLFGCANHRSRWTETGPVSAWSIVGDLRQTTVKECANLKFAYLLALEAEIDSRPWYVERALLAFHCNDGRWWLITAARNPYEAQAWRRQWTVAEAVDAWYGAKRFDSKPTESDVRRFIRDTDWHASPRTDWRRLRAELFLADWRAAFGFEPVIQFAETPPNQARHRTRPSAFRPMGLEIRDLILRSTHAVAPSRCA